LFNNQTSNHNINLYSIKKLTNEVKQANETLLFQQRERLMIELEKIAKRIDEFSDYGELEMMKQYVDDVKSVQKRIVESEKLIDWIRNVSKLLV